MPSCVLTRVSQMRILGNHPRINTLVRNQRRLMHYQRTKMGIWDELRLTAVKLLDRNVSTVNESHKGVTGGIQVYKIVKERVKDQRLPLNPSENKKPELTAVMEEMQARMEKVQEEMNTVKQQSKISVESAKGSESLKEFPDEPIKGSAPLKTDPKRVFIRSRL